MEIVKEYRLDVFLSERENISRQKAKDLILKDFVKVNNKIINKPSSRVYENSEIQIEKPEIEFVSRGGFKLLSALDYFKISPLDKICMDIGASTGGFTDCLLKNGAKKVYAIDVGTEQLHSSLKDNNKVICIENKNIKDLDRNSINEKIDLVVVDLSFVSLKKVIFHILKFADNDIICLIKPQFEAGKIKFKNGIIKDPHFRKKIVNDLVFYFKEIGLYTSEVIESPIKGQKGNTEYLIHLKEKFIS